MVATRLASGSGSPSAQHSSGACAPDSRAAPQWCLLARSLDGSGYTLRGGGARTPGWLWCSHAMPATAVPAWHAQLPTAPLLLGGGAHTPGRWACTWPVEASPETWTVAMSSRQNGRETLQLFRARVNPWGRDKIVPFLHINPFGFCELHNNPKWLLMYFWFYV
jgi:hypothetical protein